MFERFLLVWTRFVVFRLKLKIVNDLSVRLVIYFIQTFQLLDGIHNFVTAAAIFIHIQWILFAFTFLVTARVGQLFNFLIFFALVRFFTVKFLSRHCLRIPMSGIDALSNRIFCRKI